MTVKEKCNTSPESPMLVPAEWNNGRVLVGKSASKRSDKQSFTTWLEQRVSEADLLQSIPTIDETKLAEAIEQGNKLYIAHDGSTKNKEEPLVGYSLPTPKH
jgi:hypothetical protein